MNYDEAPAYFDHVENPPPVGTPDAVIHLLRLCSAIDGEEHARLRSGLIAVARELNSALPPGTRVLMARDARARLPWPSAKPSDLVAAAYVAIGYYRESPEEREKSRTRMEAWLMLQTYMQWSRAMRDAANHFFPIAGTGSDELTGHVSGEGQPMASALVGHWLASLCPVIEGWEELGLADDAVDALLAQGVADGFRKRLFRFRHGVFHFQRRLDDPRFADFMDSEGDACRWAVRLEAAFDGYFAHHTATQHADLDDWLLK